MPKLRFFVNKSLDKFMALQFINVRAGGIDFGDSIIKDHRKISKIKDLSEKERKARIDGYFDDYYKSNKKQIVRKLKQVKEEWESREADFLAISEDIFGGFKFKKGMYIGYISIIDCNPRFLESKTFQFFYKKSLDEIMYVIAHELLHFIFFDYFNERIKVKISEDDLWDLSEIFNVVLLRSEKYAGIIEKKFVRPYPDHEKHIPAFAKICKNSKNIDEFIRKGVIILKKREA